MNLIARPSDFPARSPISPFLEMGAYEALWLEEGATFKRLADRFERDPSALPSDFVSRDEAVRRANEVLRRFDAAGVEGFGVRVNHAGDYPKRLRDAKYPIEMLYYQGSWELSELPSVAVVGSRKPSDEGKARARFIGRKLAEKGFVVASGLATGIDTEAHYGAIEAGGETIAVIGTPLDSTYPKENADLQRHIARRHLLISQVPVLRYYRQNFRQNRLFFPERNATMSALTEATVIVEAGETSGTLTQARAALYQGRNLFILDSCFRREGLTWPARFAEMGAIRVRGMDELLGHLDSAI